MVLGAAVPESGYPSVVREALCWKGQGMDIGSAVHRTHRDPTFWVINRWAGDSWQYDRELLDLLGLRYVLLEKLGPGHASCHLPAEHRLWVFQDGEPRAVSARDPQQYAAVLKEITANGEIVSVKKCLIERACRFRNSSTSSGQGWTSFSSWSRRATRTSCAGS